MLTSTKASDTLMAVDPQVTGEFLTADLLSQLINVSQFTSGKRPIYGKRLTLCEAQLSGSSYVRNEI